MKEKGIEPASIPADALDSPDDIKRLIDSVESMPTEFRPDAYQTLASALTKGIGDGETALAPFTAAATMVGDWSESGEEQHKLREVALKEIAAAPQVAAQIVPVAKVACELLGIVAAMAISVPSFPSVQAAHDGLALFNKAFRDYNNTCAAEGVDSNAAIPRDLVLDVATQHFEGKRLELESQKRQLQRDLVLLKSQLAAIGVATDESASTVAEMSRSVESLRHKLAQRREELQLALGHDVFRVIDSVSRGQFPDRDSLGDQELGAAIRQAVDCGYRLTLEAPRED